MKNLQSDMKAYSTGVLNVTIEKVQNNYYFVRAFGNVGIVETEEGLVIIDSTLSVEHAKSILEELKKVTDKPIKYLIYTHGHGDHVGGARIFKEAGAQVIAHRNVITRLNKYKELNKYHYLINKRQFATDFKRTKVNDEHIYPDIVFDYEYQFTLGNKTFHLMHGKGETDDHCIIHIPEDEVVFTGDFIIRSFPNVGNPAKDIRYAKEWAEMMGRIRDLNPKITFPGHGPYITNKKDFDAVTLGYKEILETIHQHVVDYLNKGKSLDEIIQTIRFPSHLKKNPYLQQFYGCLDFAVRGTYRRYTGWYDGNPSNLLPETEDDIASEVIRFIADENVILERVSKLVKMKKHRMALHIVDFIIQGKGKLYENALEIKANILNELSLKDENFMRKNIYKNAEITILKELEEL